MGLLDGIGKQISGVAKTLGETKAGKAVSKGGSFLKKNGPSLLRRFGNDDASLITNPVGGFIGKFPVVSSILKGMGDAQETERKNKAEAESIPDFNAVNTRMGNVSRRAQQDIPLKATVGTNLRASPEEQLNAVNKNLNIIAENQRVSERNARNRANVHRDMMTAATAMVSEGIRKNAKIAATQKTAPQQHQQQGGLPPQQTTPEGAEEEGGFNSSNESFLDKLIRGGVEVFMTALIGWAGPFILPVYLGFRKLGKFLANGFGDLWKKVPSIDEILDGLGNLINNIVDGLSDMGDTILTNFRTLLPSWMPGSLSSEEAQKHKEERAANKARTKSLQTEAKKLRSSGETKNMFGFEEGYRDNRNLEAVEQQAISASGDAVKNMGDNLSETQKLVEQLKGFGAYDDDGELKAGFDVNSLSLEDLDALLDTKFKLYGLAGDYYKELLGNPATLNLNEKAYLLRLPAPTVFFNDDGSIDKDKTQQDLSSKLMRVASAFAYMSNVDGKGGRQIVRSGLNRQFEAPEDQFDALAKNPKFTLTAISSDDELYDRYLGNALIKRTETPWGIGDEQVIVHNGIPYLITEVEEGGATAQGVSETPSAETEGATAEATNISETPSTPQKVGAEEIYNQLVDDMLADDMAENISDIKEAQEEAKKNPPKSITNNNTVIQPTEKTTEVRYVTDNYTGSSEDTGLG